MGQAGTEVTTEQMWSFLRSIQTRMFDMAEQIPQIAATWAALDAMRAQAKATIVAQKNSAMGELGAVVANNPSMSYMFGLVEAQTVEKVSKIDDTTLSAYGKLSNAVAVMAFLDTRMDILIQKSIMPLEQALGVGSNYFPPAADLDKLTALGVTVMPDKPSAWMSRGMAAIRSYVNSHAPKGMKDVFQSATAAQLGKEIITQNLDVEKIAADAGASVAEAQGALEAAGMGFVLGGLEIVIIIGIIAVVAAAAGAAIFGSFSGGKASNVASIGLNNLTGLNASNLKALTGRSVEMQKQLAAEPDPAKRAEMAKRFAEELGVMADKMQKDFSSRADSIGDEINAAGKGLEMTSIALFGGLALGAVILLKATKVI
jgi:hypothetical protein